jgi:undecaprenyl-diphosphatase
VTAGGAMMALIANQDRRLMRRVQNWLPPRWVRVWMIGATRGGDGWVWYAQGFAILIFGGPPRYLAVGAAALAAGAGILVFRTLKRMTHRRRPSTLAPHCWVTRLPPDQFSFPSGHSITAFAVSVPLALFYPHIAWYLLFCAFSIAVSRVVLGMHFLSDVLAGCLIGSGLGYLSFLLLSH